MKGHVIYFFKKETSQMSLSATNSQSGMQIHFFLQSLFKLFIYEYFENDLVGNENSLSGFIKQTWESISILNGWHVDEYYLC